MAIRTRSRWPNIQLNETHPKVLYYALAGRRYEFGPEMIDWLGDQFRPPLSVKVDNDHEWDALISCLATYNGLVGDWKHDLMTDAEGLLHPAGDMTYFWP